MPFPYLGETKELNTATRQGMGGSFIALTDGVTHYELGGDEGRPVVVLVHGFSVPCFIFDPTFDFLTQNGFRVLRYDLFGRGYSDRPQTPYNVDLFVRQLKDLLDALNLKSVNLLGLSMGGPISASFMDRYPDRVTRYILIDPAGARPIDLSPLLRLVKLPMVGDLLLGLFGSAGMVKGIAADLFTPELVEQFQARYKAQMQFHGFKRAILSTMRNHMLDSFLNVYERIGKLGKPTLLFWGRQDHTVPFEHSTDLCKAIPHVDFHVIENCGHIPHYEKPEEVNRVLLEFLKR
ncbi:MAG TPA: alpha/beta hydrolase [Anaerolineales bacterium]|nr:alpha/beta hydrolase [Anaerolineales bacterium]HNN13193.1 alpha/beta hydrolase [Anaerolineales bacterium]HNO31312.1 alpha/beta hydrolase [Anaerolineales bacterium]